MRDRVYRRLLGLSPFLDRHRKELLRRGLSPRAIDRLGYASWGTSKGSRSPMAREVLADEPLAIDVPGVAIRDQGKGGYVTLAGAPGIALPIRDSAGQAQALQIMSDDRTRGKYFFLSSARYGGASPGTPVHIARPDPEQLNPGRVYVTEGILKADIASEYLGQIVVGIPGVHALGALPDALTALQSRGEITELVVAMDMDYSQNPAVAKARNLIAERAARLGIPVYLADWDQRLKGLDDLVVAGGRPKLTPYQVQGNGRRPLEPAPDRLPAPAMPKLTLSAARDAQQRALDDYFDRDRQADPGPVGLFLAAPPGTGKSHAITKAVKRHIRKRSRAQVAVFVGRHDQVKSDGREAWREIRGRTHEVEGQPDPCAFPGQQRKLVALRVSGQAGCNACPQNAVCKANTGRENGPSPQPFYLNQLRPDPGQRVSVYQAGHFLTPSAWSHARTVILDDIAVRDLQLEPVTVRRTDLEYALAWIEQHPGAAYGMAQPLLYLVSELTRQAPAGEFCLSGLDLIARLEHLASEHKITLVDALAQAREAKDPEPFPEGSSLTTSRLDVPRRFLADLLTVLIHEHGESTLSAAREVPGWNRRVEVARELGGDVVLTLALRRDLPIQSLAGKDLIISDASTTVAELAVLFPHITRWIEVRPEVEMPKSVAVIQYVDRGYGKRAMQGGKNRKAENGTDELAGPDLQADALEEIREIRRRHAGQRIGLVSYKFFSARAKREFPDLITSHFYGQRGSNRLATCDVMIVLGTPRPNPKAFLANAEALHWNESPINPQTVLETRRIGQLLTRTREFVDPRLRQLSHAKTTEEMLQAIGRIRPLSVLGYIDREQLDFDFGAAAEAVKKAQEQQRRAATVYVFSNLPLPGLDVEARRSVTRVPRPEHLAVHNGSDTMPEEETGASLIPDSVGLPTEPTPSPTGRAKRSAPSATLDLFAETIGLTIASRPYSTEPRATGPPAHAPPQPRAG